MAAMTPVEARSSVIGRYLSCRNAMEGRPGGGAGSSAGAGFFEAMLWKCSLWVVERGWGMR